MVGIINVINNINNSDISGSMNNISSANDQSAFVDDRRGEDRDDDDDGDRRGRGGSEDDGNNRGQDRLKIYNDTIQLHRKYLI